MGRVAGAVALFLISLVMLLGVERSTASLAAPSTMIAIVLTVVLPAAGGIALLAGRVRGRRQLAGRREQLRQQTIEAEILRLAERHAGKLTVVDVVGALAVSPESAKIALDGLHTQDLAEIEITDSGVLVYVFHDVQRMKEKAFSRGLLDA